MWMKDGRAYKGILRTDKYIKWGASDAELRAAGYEWVEPPAPPVPPKRYSKLKIIRALGDGWAAKKLQLEQAGLYDQFVAAAFLAADDPAFAPVYAGLTDEEKAILDEECLYEE